MWFLVLLENFWLASYGERKKKEEGTLIDVLASKTGGLIDSPHSGTINQLNPKKSWLPCFG